MRGIPKIAWSSAFTVAPVPEKQQLAEKGYATYDFFLPGLVIDAIENRRGTHLAAWAKEIVEKKISTVNMLGCHDGIPLLDLKGLLPKEEIQSLIDRIVSRGGMVKNLHGQKNLYYQVNATYYSAFATLYVNFESGTYTILESR